MEQLIRLRLTSELYMLKKDRWGCAYDLGRITDIPNPWSNTQLYNAEELEDSALFTLKKDVFQKRFLSSLMEQTQIMHDFDAKEVKEEVEALKSRSLPDYMKWAKENCVPSCLWYGKYTIVSPLYCSEKLYTSTDGMDYLMEGRAVMECYDSLFTYIHNAIRKTSVNSLKGMVTALLD